MVLQPPVKVALPNSPKKSAGCMPGPAACAGQDMSTSVVALLWTRRAESPAFFDILLLRALNLRNHQATRGLEALLVFRVRVSCAHGLWGPRGAPETSQTRHECGLTEWWIGVIVIVFSRFLYSVWVSLMLAGVGGCISIPGETWTFETQIWGRTCDAPRQNGASVL